MNLTEPSSLSAIREAIPGLTVQTDSLQVGSSSYIFSYALRTCQQSKPRNDRKYIFLGACLIAAVRLAREEKWDNSPCGISDSGALARCIERLKWEYRITSLQAEG